MAAGRMNPKTPWTVTGVLLCALLATSQATLVSCGNSNASQAQSGETRAEEDDGVRRETVEIRGRRFRLEIADDNEKRIKGLSGRTEIAEDGGMLFVFPRPQQAAFVMRDCLVDIDIIFLDTFGQVLSTYEMEVEDPRRPDESEAEYEERLKKYHSRGPAQFVIELRGGTLKTFEPELKRMRDVIRLDRQRLIRDAS